VLLYRSMLGDATLFARSDLVEASWRIVQPILDTWAAEPPADFPSYDAGGWGPRAAYRLLEQDGRKWVEVVSRTVIEKVPLFQDTSVVFQYGVALVLKSLIAAPGDEIVRKGDAGQEMYFVARGEVEVVDGDRVLRTLPAGSFFGERSLLLEEPRSATVRAKTGCDLFVLEKADFLKALREQPNVAKSVAEYARKQYAIEI